MKKLLSAIGLSLLSFGAIADDHAPTIFGIETYACNYNEGKTLEDLLGVSKKWDKFASKNFYFIFILALLLWKRSNFTKQKERYITLNN